MIMMMMIPMAWWWIRITRIGALYTCTQAHCTASGVWAPLPPPCLPGVLSSPNSRAHLGSHSLTPHSIKTSQQRPEFHCRTWSRGSRWLDWLLSPSSLSALPLCFLSGGGPQVFDDDDDHELSTLPWFWSDSVQQVLMMIVMLKMNGN